MVADALLEPRRGSNLISNSSTNGRSSNSSVSLHPGSYKSFFVALRPRRLELPPRNDQNHEVVSALVKENLTRSLLNLEDLFIERPRAPFSNKSQRFRQYLGLGRSELLQSEPCSADSIGYGSPVPLVRTDSFLSLPTEYRSDALRALRYNIPSRDRTFVHHRSPAHVRHPAHGRTLIEHSIDGTPLNKPRQVSVPSPFGIQKPFQFQNFPSEHRQASLNSSPPSIARGFRGLNGGHTWKSASPFGNYCTKPELRTPPSCVFSRQRHSLMPKSMPAHHMTPGSRRAPPTGGYTRNGRRPSEVKRRISQDSAPTGMFCSGEMPMKLVPVREYGSKLPIKRDSGGVKNSFQSSMASPRQPPVKPTTGKGRSTTFPAAISNKTLQGCSSSTPEKSSKSLLRMAGSFLPPGFHVGIRTNKENPKRTTDPVVGSVLSKPVVPKSDIRQQAKESLNILHGMNPSAEKVPAFSPKEFQLGRNVENKFKRHDQTPEKRNCQIAANIPRLDLNKVCPAMSPVDRPVNNIPPALPAGLGRPNNNSIGGINTNIESHPVTSPEYYHLNSKDKTPVTKNPAVTHSMRPKSLGVPLDTSDQVDVYSPLEGGLDLPESYHIIGDSDCINTPSLTAACSPTSLSPRDGDSFGNDKEAADPCGRPLVSTNDEMGKHHFIPTNNEEESVLEPQFKNDSQQNFCWTPSNSIESGQSSESVRESGLSESEFEEPNEPQREDLHSHLPAILPIHRPTATTALVSSRSSSTYNRRDDTLRATISSEEINCTPSGLVNSGTGMEAVLSSPCFSAYEREDMVVLSETSSPILTGQTHLDAETYIVEPTHHMSGSDPSYKVDISTSMQIAPRPISSFTERTVSVHDEEYSLATSPIPTPLTHAAVPTEQIAYNRSTDHIDAGMPEESLGPMSSTMVEERFDNFYVEKPPGEPPVESHRTSTTATARPSHRATTSTSSEDDICDEDGQDLLAGSTETNPDQIFSSDQRTILLPSDKHLPNQINDYVSPVMAYPPTAMDIIAQEESFTSKVIPEADSEACDLNIRNPADILMEQNAVPLIIENLTEIPRTSPMCMEEGRVSCAEHTTSCYTQPPSSPVNRSREALAFIANDDDSSMAEPGAPSVDMKNSRGANNWPHHLAHSDAENTEKVDSCSTQEMTNWMRQTSPKNNSASFTELWLPITKSSPVLFPATATSDRNEKSLYVNVGVEAVGEENNLLLVKPRVRLLRDMRQSVSTVGDLSVENVQALEITTPPKKRYREAITECVCWKKKSGKGRSKRSAHRQRRNSSRRGSLSVIDIVVEQSSASVRVQKELTIPII